jgi:kumamolisin
VSAACPRPVWQDAIDIQSANENGKRGRVIPDVSACAGTFSYRYVTEEGSMRNGGTSAAAQLWAGLLALVRSTGQPLSFITPLFYQKHEQDDRLAGEIACRDVLSGNNRTFNKGYDAGPGFDAVTGWGSPNGVQLPLVLSAAQPAIAAGNDQVKTG